MTDPIPATPTVGLCMHCHNEREHEAHDEPYGHTFAAEPPAPRETADAAWIDAVVKHIEEDVMEADATNDDGAISAEGVANIVYENLREYRPRIEAAIRGTPAGLDAAWREAEAALHAAATGSRWESTELAVFRNLTDADEPVKYTATAERIEFRDPGGPPAETMNWEADGPTPEAALLALAAALGTRP